MFADVTDNFDYVFWSGDLNFRLTRPRTEVLDWIARKTFPLSEPAQSTPGDQLTDSIIDGESFHFSVNVLVLVLRSCQIFCI